MLSTLLAVYLLLILPAKNLWDSLRPKTDKPPQPLMKRYLGMAWKPLAMLAALAVIAVQSGYTLDQLGLGMPMPPAGNWGLLAAVLLLAALMIASANHERKMTPEKRAAYHQQLLASPLPLPQKAQQVAPFIASTTIMTAAWEILYRGFLLLFLSPWVGLPAAIVIASLAYGVAHGFTNARQLILSIVMALLFTGAYALTGSLWWLILIHAGLPLTGMLSLMRTRPASGH